uniref:Protein PLANT CADMIUM RESISTANCE 2-like n=1 Tax=Nelumbo nucifera TaxID=4432 RepID=A0A822YSV6_NELNU|nr:TPA_asm: hypothetical protein HUJ06_006372 [Nelumbo nucifera]
MYPSNAGNYTAAEPPKFSSSPMATASLSAPQFSQPTPIGVPMDMPPPAFPTQTQRQVPWSTGLCDCCDDVPLCCITCWCPCITFAQISEIIDKGTSSCGMNGAIYTIIAYFTGCACLYSCFYRTKLRHQYSLQESPCGDCFVHFCCESCALCQEYRELKSRGFNMAIGWHANVEWQNRGITMAPMVQGGMIR